MSNIDLEPLRTAIRHYKMMALWRDSIEDLSLQEQATRAKKKALEAKDLYVRLMISGQRQKWKSVRAKVNRFLGSSLEKMTVREIDEVCEAFYQTWAAKKALGLRTNTHYTAQAIGGKHWQAWGKADE